MDTVSMSAIDILAELRLGATLSSCWKARRFFATKAVRLYILEKSNGELIRVQESAVVALVAKRGVRAIASTFGRTRYELP